MSGVVLVQMMVLGVVLVLGLAVIFRARPEDIPELVRTLVRFIGR
jgi:hypothetical protein